MIRPDRWISRSGDRSGRRQVRSVREIDDVDRGGRGFIADEAADGRPTRIATSCSRRIRGDDPESQPTTTRARQPPVIPDEMDEDEWADACGGRTGRADLRRGRRRAASAGAASAGSRRLRSGGGRGHPGLPLPAASPGHADPARSRPSPSPWPLPVLINWLWIGAAVSCALLIGYLALSASSGPDRGGHPAEADGAAAACPADPARVRRAPRAGPAPGMSAVAPGRTVVDLDDDDPGFDDLEEYRAADDLPASRRPVSSEGQRRPEPVAA